MIARRGPIMRLLQGGALSLVAVLAGCSTTTYGTGVGPAAQTLQDLTNIVNFGPGEIIQYCERPGLQMPPPGAPLPPPLPPGETPPPCPQP